MWHVYVLRSLRDGNLYIGMTSRPLSERLRRHNAERVRSTNGRCPFKLVYAESCTTSTRARARERFFKTGAGREELNRLIEKGGAEPAGGGQALHRRASNQTRLLGRRRRRSGPSELFAHGGSNPPFGTI